MGYIRDSEEVNELLEAAIRRLGVEKLVVIACSVVSLIIILIFRSQSDFY